MRGTISRILSPRTFVLLGLVLAAVTYFLHFRYALRHFLDIPLGDGQTVYVSTEIKSFPPRLTWLFQAYFERRYVLSRFLMACLALLGTINFITVRVISFVLFGGAVLSSWLSLSNVFEKKHAAYAALFIPFLMLPISPEAHLWDILMAYHKAYLFFFLGVYFLSLEKIFFALFSFMLSVFSDSPGVLMTFGFALFYFFKIFYDYFRNKTPLNRKQIGLGIGIALPATLFMSTYQSVASGSSFHPEYSMPWGAHFWNYFLRLLTMTFAMREGRIRRSYQLISFILIFIPLIHCSIQSIKSKKNLSGALGFALIFCLVIVAVTRGKWDLFIINQYIPSRYYIFSILLLPFVAAGWSQLLEGKKLRVFLLPVIWLFCLLGYQRGIYLIEYERQYQEQLGKQTCYIKIAKGSNDPCPEEMKEAPPEAIREHLKLARMAGFSYGNLGQTNP